MTTLNTRPAPKSATPAPDRDAVRDLEAKLAAREKLLDENFPGWEMTEVVQAAGPYTPSHPVDRDAVRDAARALVSHVDMTFPAEKVGVKISLVLALSEALTPSQGDKP